MTQSVIIYQMKTGTEWTWTSWAASSMTRGSMPGEFNMHASTLGFRSRFLNLNYEI
jgi:uncharacterized protein affecting Mg2+/Co2+ transport